MTKFLIKTITGLICLTILQSTVVAEPMATLKPGSDNENRRKLASPISTGSMILSTSLCYTESNRGSSTVQSQFELRAGFLKFIARNKSIGLRLSYGRYRQAAADEVCFGPIFGYYHGKGKSAGYPFAILGLQFDSVSGEREFSCIRFAYELGYAFHLNANYGMSVAIYLGQRTLEFGGNSTVNNTLVGASLELINFNY